MVGELTGFLHIVRGDTPIDPVTAEYRIAFAPLGGRLRSRHAMVHGLDRLTAFLRQAHVPTPEVERAWRVLATRRVHAIPRVGLTRTQIAAARILGWGAPSRQLSNTCNLFRCGRYPN